MESTNSKSSVMDGGDLPDQRMELRKQLMHELEMATLSRPLEDVEKVLATLLGHGFYLGIKHLDGLYEGTKSNPDMRVRKAVGEWIAKARGHEDSREMQSNSEYGRMLQDGGVVESMIDDVLV